MATLSTGQLCGGFWDVQSSGLIDAYASAVLALLETVPAAATSSPQLGVLPLRTAGRVASTSGRPLIGYPNPLAFDPAWVALGPDRGPLVRGVDFDVAGGVVWFEQDPLATAPTAYLDFTVSPPANAADVLAGLGPPPAPPAAPTAGTAAALGTALALACDSPTTATTETVVDVWTGADGLVRVITDQSAYRLPLGDVAGAAIGTTLPPASPLGSAWVLTRLGPGKPALAALTTPSWFHQGITASGITWYDTTVPLVVDVVASRTRVRWALGGSSPDVTAFWAESHRRGTLPGARSLAQAMDLRAGASNDPDATSLPTTVNPLDFVSRQLFGGAGYLLVVQPSRFGPLAVSAAARQTATRLAAGTYAGVIEYSGAMPTASSTGP